MNEALITSEIIDKLDWIYHPYSIMMEVDSVSIVMSRIYNDLDEYFHQLNRQGKIVSYQVIGERVDNTNVLFRVTYRMAESGHYKVTCRNLTFYESLTVEDAFDRAMEGV